MYGTVSRYRLTPGSEPAAVALSQEMNANPPPGYVASYTFRLDAGGDQYITAAVWNDRETYNRSANDERQQRWFARVSELIVGEPEWNDGEVIFPAASW